jgi:uncharacterized membrane protein
MQWNYFLGRWHPLAVHLPIGFLLLGIILFFIARKRNIASLNVAVRYAYILGAVGALISVIMGLMLEKTGAYENDTLSWHKWLGIILNIIAVVVWAILKFTPQKTGWVIGLNIAIVLLLTGTGHYGGTLTHGKGYLTQYAPKWVKKLTAHKEDTAFKLPANTTSDSLVVYDKLLHPIIQRKCVACHNEKISYGGLVLTTPQLFAKGGDNGAAYVSGSAYKSLIFERVTLPRNNPKAMPPKGDPLTYAELQVLENWINNGADFTKKLGNHELTPAAKHIFAKQWGLTTEKLPYLQSVVVAAAGENAMKQLQEQGFTIRKIMTGKNILDIKYESAEPLTAEKVKLLQPIALQIGLLDVSNTTFSDDMDNGLFNAFQNMVRLNVANTKTTDKLLKALAALKHLEVINAIGTQITDNGLQTISASTSLKRLYTWNTTVTAPAIDNLVKSKKDFQVVQGFQK